MQVHPNKLLGLLGDHEDFPVEVMKFSHDKKLIGSVSHVNKVHFWDVAYLFDEDDDDDDEVEEVEDVDAAGDAGGQGGGDNDDAEMEDADSDDSDDSDDGGNMGGVGGGRRVMPSANERFFSDL